MSDLDEKFLMITGWKKKGKHRRCGKCLDDQFPTHPTWSVFKVALFRRRLKSGLYCDPMCIDHAYALDEQEKE